MVCYLILVLMPDGNNEIQAFVNFYQYVPPTLMLYRHCIIYTVFSLKPAPGVCAVVSKGGLQIIKELHFKVRHTSSHCLQAR